MSVVGGGRIPQSNGLRSFLFAVQGAVVDWLCRHKVSECWVGWEVGISEPPGRAVIDVESYLEYVVGRVAEGPRDESGAL
jgi:hypothetical protein